MERKFRITVEGKAYIVAVEDLGAATQHLYPEPGSMRAAAAPAPTPAAPPAPAAGAAYASAHAATAGPGDEVAPLGGVVQAVHVAVGQTVAGGDKLVSIEAMKMVTHVLARSAGRVTRVDVKAGDPVDAGQPLLGIG